MVGVDAGTTVAIGVIDLSGRVVRVESRKEWPHEELINTIASYSPLVIACDTNPSHHLARELGSAFGAKLFFPHRSLSKHAKALSTRDVKCRNSHERDALASALKAWGHYQNKVRQAVTKASRAGMTGVDSARVVRLVLGGEKIAHALRGAPSR